jgi:hypothetical protein
MKPKFVALLSVGLGLLLVTPAGAAVKAAVTPDGHPYRFVVDGSTVIVTASKHSGSDEREFFWDRKSPVEADSTVCATFASGGGLDQQGVVLRLTDAAGVITGITVTRNVFAYDFQTFNFHIWDTATSPPYTQFGSVTISALPYAPATYPLNLCARTVSAADEVELVVWTAGMTQPAWGDPTWGGGATIPAGAPAAGRGGFFVGHVRPGMPTTFTNLSVDAEAL